MTHDSDILLESIAFNYRNNPRYDSFTAKIGKKYGWGEFSEMSVKNASDQNTWALRFGPGRGDMSGKITYLIGNFSLSKRDNAGQITHYAVSTIKEPVELIKGEYRLRSGFVFLKIPDNVKSFNQLAPLVSELNRQNYQSTSINTRRAGTDISPDQLGIAAANPERTQKYYDNAASGRGYTGKSSTGAEIRFEPNSIEAETFWIMKVFNNTEAAINATLSLIKKEVNNKVGSWDELTDAYSDLEAAGNETSPEAKINWDAPYILSITRDPGEIVMFDDYTRKLYADFESEFKKRVADSSRRIKYATMIVTYMLTQKSLESYVSFKLPYIDEVTKMVAKMKAQGAGDSLSGFGKFFDVMYGIGDQRRVLEMTIDILKDVVKGLEGKGFQVKYVPDGDETTIHFVWEGRNAVPDQVLKKVANLLVKGRGALKLKDLMYILPAAIFNSKRRKFPEYRDLGMMFKNKPEGKNEVAYFTRELIRGAGSRKAKAMIQKLLLRLVANEELLHASMIHSVNRVDS